MKVQCLNCFVVFEKRPFEIMKSPNHFCSRSCSVAYQNRVNPKRMLQGKCQNCSHPCPSTRKFCNSKCSTEYSTKLRIENPPKSRYEIVKSSRQRMKEKAVEYLGGKCLHCNYNRCFRALTFHHINPLEKENNISTGYTSWEKMRKELDKCVLLCSNCHLEIHAGILILDEQQQFSYL